MGKIRTKTVKKAARQIVQKYYDKLCLDYDLNKKVVDDVAIIQSKRLRNQIAGYVTRLMKRIKWAPKGVKGISLKLQEEQREKRLDYVPETSALEDQKLLAVHPETLAMLRQMGMHNSPGIRINPETQPRRRRKKLGGGGGKTSRR